MICSCYCKLPFPSNAMKERIKRNVKSENTTDMGHHEHSHTSHVDGNLNKTFIVAISLNLAFVAVEATIGWMQGALALLSDAGHNLLDVFSLLLALLAFRLSAKAATKHFTYGGKKATILISLLNAILLLGAVIIIVIESIEKISNPVPVNGVAISWTAGVGIIVNGLTTVMLMKKQSHDLNVKGAFLHMLADTLVSVGVVISGVIIILTGNTLIDPIISIIIASVILFSTWHLLEESLRMALDGTPSKIDIDKVQKEILAIPYVESIHHLHIWAISTTEIALTAHVVMKDFSHSQSVKEEIRHKLASSGITHCTLETETTTDDCENKLCR
mgnify:FL=1